MFGLIDCNNFFVSCERVFNPDIRRRPVIVLSNNDGCIVALSNEAKVLGLRRGNPYFQIEHICERNNVAVYSGNHKLYGDMSSRVMAILSSLVPDIEIYSIDEAFFNLDGIDAKELPVLGREIAKKIRRNTGIPISVGISSTMTLAKLASRFAKNYSGYHSACLINSDETRRKALSLTNVSDIWGVGRKLGRRFYDIGVDNALQFADMSEAQVTRMFNISGQRTWREINGDACISLEMSEPAKKQMCCSRSFGSMLTEFEELHNAISLFTSIVSRKLRTQKSAAVSISVFIHTNAYRSDLEQYFKSAHRNLSEATSDTIELTKAATECLRSIYRRGYQYKKAGVLINEIIDENAVRRSLFTDSSHRNKRQKLMSVLDDINRSSSGRNSVHLASYSPMHSIVKSERHSRLYTTRFDDIISVR